MKEPLDYHKPPQQPDPFWFNLLCAIGCALGLIIVAVVILDRFDVSLVTLWRSRPSP